MHACNHSGPTPLQLVLRNSAAVTNLKAAIVRATGIPVDRQHLMRTAGALTDGNSALAMLSPTEQQHLLVHELARPGSMVLIAKTLTGKIIPLSVSPEDTILDVKEHIRDSEGIPADQQRVIWAGRQLANDQTVAGCGIGAEATVDLVLFFRGD